jgi:putative PEP-CTERM system histidine kinase
VIGTIGFTAEAGPAQACSHPGIFAVGVVDAISLLFYSTAAFAAVIAVLAALRDRKSPARRTFSAALLLLAIQTFLAGLIRQVDSLSAASFWRSWWLIPQTLVPPVWLLFVLKYSRGNYQVSLRKWLPLLIGTTALPLLAITVFHDSALIVSDAGNRERFQIGFGGYILYLCIVLCSALILVNLERTFRAAVGTMRWRIKFVVLGTGAIFIAKLYTSSQVLLFNFHAFTFDIINAVALLVASLLFLRGLLRAGIFQVQLYPSEQVIQYSVVGVLIGAYLILIGVFSKLFQTWQGPEAFAFKAFLLLASLAMLGIVLLSERVRDRLKRWISRHFHRPFFDYRALWLSFTEKTATIVDPDGLCRILANWLSEHLHVLSTSVWLVDTDAKSIQAAASTGITAPTLQLSTSKSSELIENLEKESAPFDIDQRSEPWVTNLKQCYADQFRHGGNRVCVPFIAAGRLVGFCTLGDRVNNIALERQEFELLKCIGDQIASNLLNLQLSNRLIQAREMQAFQTISAFFVHDLKNTASTLNLTLQNLPKHFDNPEFRKDALKAISKSVTHIQELIGRLSLFRQKLELNCTRIDLNMIARAALESLQSTSLSVSTDFSELKPVSADPEQIQKVLTNLLLNAREALPDNGNIEISTAQQNGCAVVAVSDNGCGMSPEFLSRSLFRPFKTTKKGGIGIGMFQSKAIIEAHGGRIEVESEVNRGTTFRVYLPTQ